MATALQATWEIRVKDAAKKDNSVQTELRAAPQMRSVSSGEDREATRVR